MASNFRAYAPGRFNLAFLSRIHPCCGFPLEKASAIIAIIHMVMSGIFACLLLFCIAVLSVTHEDHAKAKFEDGSVEYWKYKLGIKVIILMLVVISIFVILYFFLSRLLYKGVKERSFRKVDIWWKIMVAVTMAIIVHNIISIFQYKGEHSVGLWEIFDVLFDIYSLWVVYEYKKELQLPSESTVEFDRVLQMP